MNEMTKVEIHSEAGWERVWATPLDKFNGKVVILENEPVESNYYFGQTVKIDNDNIVTGPFVDLDEKAKQVEKKAEEQAKKQKQMLLDMEQVNKLAGRKVMVAEKVGIIAGYVPTELGSSSNINVVFEDGTEKRVNMYNALEIISKYNRNQAAKEA